MAAMQQALLTLPTAIATDPYYSNVSLLLHMDGTNGSTTFTDNSPVPKTVTAAGPTQISTAQYKFGGASGSFTTSYISTPDNTAFDFGVADFTIECWVRLNSRSNYIIINKAPGTGYYPFQLYYDGSRFYFRGFDTANNLIYSLFNSFDAAENTWHHVAGVRSGTTFSIYVNGVVGQQTTSAAALYQAPDPVYIGAYGTSQFPLNGYIDDLRITKGIARYTSNFTPPTAAFPNQ